MKKINPITIALVGAAASLSAGVFAQNQNFGVATTAKDPGVRAGSIGAGMALSTLTADETEYFNDGLSRFMQVDSVSGTLAGRTEAGWVRLSTPTVA